MKPLKIKQTTISARIDQKLKDKGDAKLKGLSLQYVLENLYRRWVEGEVKV